MRLLALVLTALAPARAAAQEPAAEADRAAALLERWRPRLAQLERAEIELPPPQPAVHWRADLAAALAEARATDRPLFVTLRCLPCKQCAGFDQAVLEGGPRLDPLLARFVTVRLTDARAIDLRLLDVAGFQDLDLSWWGWLLSPAGAVHAVFGGRDEVSDTTRISVPALVATLRRVLEHHYARPPDERTAGPELAGRPRTPEDLPGFAAWAARAPDRDERCLHCHQVAEVLRQPAIDRGAFDPRRDLEIWPYPENVGLALDRDHGLAVTRVEPESPAARLGVVAGDVLAAAGEHPLFGQTDLRAVLHRAPRGDARVPLVWWHGDELRAGELALADGWKRTVLDWRMSVSQGNVGVGPGFFPLRAPAGDRRRLDLADDAMAVAPFFGKRPSGPAWEAGLRPGHVITAVDGERPPKHGRAFLVWWRQRTAPGAEVTLTVRDGQGAERTIRYAPR